MDFEVMQSDIHLTDRELVLAADGELAEPRLSEARSHLASCLACRARTVEMDGTMADFVDARQQSDSQLPSGDRARAALRARLVSLAAEPPPGVWDAFFGFSRAHLGLASLAVVLLTIAGLTITTRVLPRRSQYESGVVPDPRLTPGAVRRISEKDVCATESTGRATLVPAAFGQRIFDEYGIHNPQSRAYELDYLITPELGGSDDIRNFWPQPYSSTGWNSHVKDALENHLHELVCSNQISLATAQHELATNWVSAYKKYFKTENPLPDHIAFAKDRPWEQ
jgi:hypothetical protein